MSQNELISPLSLLLPSVHFFPCHSERVAGSRFLPFISAGLRGINGWLLAEPGFEGRAPPVTPCSPHALSSLAISLFSDPVPNCQFFSLLLSTWPQTSSPRLRRFSVQKPPLESALSCLLCPVLQLWSSAPTAVPAGGILWARACSATQSCPTLGDPMDCRPPGSSLRLFLPHIISFFSYSEMKLDQKRNSRRSFKS